MSNYGMVGGMVGILLVSFVIGLVVQALFILFGIKVAKIADGTFGKAFLCALLIMVVNLIVGYLLMGRVSMIVSIIIGAVVAIFIIKGVHKITYDKAFVGWIFSVIAAVVTAVIVGAASYTILMHFMH